MGERCKFDSVNKKTTGRDVNDSDRYVIDVSVTPSAHRWDTPGRGHACDSVTPSNTAIRNSGVPSSACHLITYRSAGGRGWTHVQGEGPGDRARDGDVTGAELLGLYPGIRNIRRMRLQF